MNQEIKNFDRTIEHMMNESAVAPPFGMWNRISADLDSADAVAATSAASTPAPKRALAGMLIGVMVIGASLVTAYMVNTPDNNQLTVTSTVQQPTAVTTLPEQQSIAPVEKAIVAIPVAKDKPVAKRSQISLAKVETPADNKQTPEAQQIFVPINNTPNNDVEVLVPLVAVDQNKPKVDAYYFPAVDMYTGENKMKETKTAAVAKVARTEKTTETEVSASSAPRIKFRPKKHGKYNYGKINRTHSRRR